ncbi:MAG TPA: NAD(P)/FAD-dependent oxidoreductase [Gemmatimonadales bacterium]|nr:NAD(P)/FAD-dependent oxidoreductase [Gemmatimonadales bacterium]
MTDVVVIGGGMAGLAAAERLVDSGAAVTLLEGRHRFGGRVLTEPGSLGGAPIDLGAEWIGAEGELHDLLVSSGARLVEARGRQLRRAGREWQDLSDLSSLARRLVQRAHDPAAADRSLVEALGECGIEAEANADEVRAHLLRYVEGFHAADPERLSVRWLAQVESTQPAEASEIRSAGGLWPAVDALVRVIDGRCDLRLGTLVTSVRWRPGSVEIHTERGATYRGSAAVVTVPLPLLDPATDQPAAIRFTPTLGDKRAAARTLPMGPVVKVVLAFRRAFWRDIESLEDALFVHAYDQPLPTWWTASDPNLPLITGWAGGPYAARLAGAAGEALKDLSVISLAAALGMAPRQVASQLEAWHSHDWTADPLARGAYSYVAVGGADAWRVLAEPVSGTLYFAGEATCGGGYNATVEGALRSGRRAAEQVLRG